MRTGTEYRTTCPLYVVCGEAWTTPEGPDDGGICILKADRNEPGTFGAQRDDNIKFAVECWNKQLEEAASHE